MSESGRPGRFGRLRDRKAAAAEDVREETAPAATPAPTIAALPPVAPKAADVRASTKTRKTFNVPEGLYAELRGAADVLRDKPHRLTMTDLVEEALRAGITHLRERYNNGEPFEPLWENLPGGRPLGR